MTCPPSWAITKLGDICEVVSGSTPSTAVPEYWGGEIAWITPDDLSRHAGKLIARGARNITQAGYDSCSTRLVPQGTVLFTSRAPIGYVAIAAHSVCTNQGFKSFIPSAAVTSDYLYWFLRYATPAIRELGSGTTFPELSKARAKEIQIPVAPLAEQRRIVAAIEEHFSRLDAAEESLRRAGARLRVMRDAVYMRAISGAWRKVPLRSLLRERLRNGHSAKPSQDGAGIRTLTLSAVTTGEFSEKNTKLTTADPTRVRDLWLKPGDILIERSNTPELVGTAALYHGPHQWAIFPDLLIRIRVSELVLPEFLEAVLKARPTRRYFQRVAQGIAGSMPKIDQTDVANLEVPLPPLDEQRRIVAEVEQQLSVVDAMAAEIDRALKRSAALRRSILAQAFSGKLVPQDRSDEPASVLLERIRAERAAAETTTGRRPRRRANMWQA